MANYKETNQPKIVNIDRDTAIYVLEKVVDAINNTLNDSSKPLNDYLSEIKNPKEMLETFYNKLQDILNEIKKR